MNSRNASPFPWISVTPVLLSVAARAAQPVAITNSSFEQPVIEVDGATGPAPTGWSAFNGAQARTFSPQY